MSMAEIINLGVDILPDCAACQEATKRVMARTMDVEGAGVPGVIYTCDNRPCKAKRNAVGAYILRKEITDGKT